MNKFKFGILSILSLVLLAGVYYMTWSFQRWIHYKVSYESKVQEEIRWMVKKECLK